MCLCVLLLGVLFAYPHAISHVGKWACACQWLHISVFLCKPVRFQTGIPNGHLTENKMDDILCPFITFYFLQLMVTVCCLLCNGQSRRTRDVTEKLRTGIRAVQRLKTWKLLEQTDSLERQRTKDEEAGLPEQGSDQVWVIHSSWIWPGQSREDWVDRPSGGRQEGSEPQSQGIFIPLNFFLNTVPFLNSSPTTQKSSQHHPDAALQVHDCWVGRTGWVWEREAGFKSQTLFFLLGHFSAFTLSKSHFSWLVLFIFTIFFSPSFCSEKTRR